MDSLEKFPIGENVVDDENVQFSLCNLQPSFMKDVDVSMGHVYDN
jgi:hypothetical protein